MHNPETRNLNLLQRAIEDNDLDAIVAVNHKSVAYLSNIPLWAYQQRRADGPRVCLAVWPREGEPVVIIGELEYEATQETSWISRIECYPDYAKTPYQRLAETLDELHLRGKRIGIERRAIGSIYWQEFANAHHETIFIEAGYLLDNVRAHKTPAEVDLARHACNLLDRAFLSVFSAARPGMTELDLHAELVRTVHAMGGSDLDGGHLLSGERAMVIHRPMTRKQILPGDIIRTDYHASFGGRQANLSRVFVVGAPSKEQQAIYRILCEIEQEVFNYVRPNVRACDLFRFYVEQVKRRSLTPDLPLLGHSIGIELHEEPMIIQNDTGILDEDMVLCIEPFILKQYQIQDQLLITPKGAELLSRDFDTKELFVIE